MTVEEELREQLRRVLRTVWEDDTDTRSHNFPPVHIVCDEAIRTLRRTNRATSLARKEPTNG